MSSLLDIYIYNGYMTQLLLLPGSTGRCWRLVSGVRRSRRGRQAADLARVVADHAADGADTEGELCLSSVALLLQMDLLQELIHALLTRLFYYP